MAYTVSVYDTQDILPPLTGTELAGARSIVLSHRGGDMVDAAPVIGGALSWTFIGLDCSDGKYKDLFTGSEERFRVELTDDGTLVWSGFLLPDTYKEPYRNYVQDVSFQAVDGLGRLKGKFLRDLPIDVSVTDLIVRLLRLTGLDLNLRFSPAIVNYSQPDFDKIWLSAEPLLEQDAFELLQGLAIALGCSVYQIDNRWYFEGLIYRNQRELPYSDYSPSGAFLGSGVFFKNVKVVTPLAGGNIETVPPYGWVDVVFNQSVPTLSPELTSVEGQDWADYEGAADNNTVFARAWLMKPEHPMLANSKDGVFYTPEVSEQYVPIEDAVDPFSVADRPYLLEGHMYRLNLAIRLVVTPKGELDWEEGDPWFMERLSGPAFSVELAGEALLGGSRSLDTHFSKAISIEFEGQTSGEDFIVYVNQEPGTGAQIDFKAPASGLLDIKIAREIMARIREGSDFELSDFEYKVVIETLSLESLEAEGSGITYQAVRDNSEEYTSVKEVDLLFAGTPLGGPNVFKLSPTYEDSADQVFTQTVRRRFKIGDFWYYIVDLKTAYLIDLYRDSVTDVMGDEIEVDDVVYNWGLSQEHAIISKDWAFSPIDGVPHLRVLVPYATQDEHNRSDWGHWGSAHYRNQQISFVEAQADMYHSLFREPEIRFTGEFWDNLKINDLVQMEYGGEVRNLALTSCDWNLDNGSAMIVASQTSLDVRELPPSVEVIVMEYLEDDQMQLQVETMSPGSEVTSVVWSVEEGVGSFNNPNVENPILTFSGVVKVRVEATDSDGRQGFDEVFVYERGDVSISPVNATRFLPQDGLEVTIPITINGDIPEDYVLNIRGIIQMDVGERFLEGDSAKLLINGVEVVASEINLDHDDIGQWQTLRWEAPFSISIRKDDVAQIIFTADADRSAWDVGDLRAYVRLSRSQFIVGYGSIAGPPSREDRPNPRPGTRPDSGGGGNRRRG